MAASRGQALFLINFFCSQTSDKTRLHERSVVRLPPATPSILVSVLAERQRSRIHHRKAAPKSYNIADVEQSVVLDSNKTPRKGRRRKLPLGECEGNNGSTTSIRKSKQDFLFQVRSVDNAEDTCNEITTLHFAACHKSVEEKSEKRYASESKQALTDNSGCSISHTDPNYEGKSMTQAALESHSRQHNMGPNVNKINPGNAALVNGMSTSCNISLEESQWLPPIENSSAQLVSPSRKKPGQRRRRKSDGEHSEKDCSHLKPDSDALPQAVTLEHDAKQVENVVNFAESLGSLSSASSSHLVINFDKDADMVMDSNAAGSKDKIDKVKRVRSRVAGVIECNETASKGSSKGYTNLFRVPKHVKGRKFVQKQLSAEEFNDSKEYSEVPRVSASDQGMCTVRWLVETHLDVNQKLFLVGGHPQIGAWHPSMAIGFSLSEETGNSNLWQGQSQVPFGISSEYNYFVQVGDEKTHYIVWRPGPRLHFATPPKGFQDTEVIIKDALDFNIVNKLPALLWEGLQNDIGFPTELKRFFGDKIASEESSDLTTLDTDSGISASKHKVQPDLSLQDLVIESPKEDFQCCQHIAQGDDAKNEALQSDAEDVVFVEKPQAQGAAFTTVKLTPKLQKLIRKRVFPREEPWLMESMILFEKTDILKAEAANIAEIAHEVDVDDSQDIIRDNIAEKKAEKQIEILINASKCTMERIAILENGKLVELLLKPVNSDINVGNVYLGIVKKLLPGMTGVFVDIGHPRVALLSITKNVYPFTFPPIISGNSADDQINDAEGHFLEKQGSVSVDSGQSDMKCNGVMEEDWEIENEDDEEDEDPESILDVEELADTGSHLDASHEGEVDEKQRGRKLLLMNDKGTRPITVNFGQRFTKWRKVEEGMRIIVQVKREPLGKKGPKVCAFPQLSSRFWVLGLGGKSVGVSKKINGPERKRLKDLASLFQKPGFDLTVRTEAAGQSQDDLEKDLARLLETWKDIMEQAESVSMAAQNGQDGAIPALLHRAMGQTLSIVRDFFADKVQRMVVDSVQTYHEVTCYLQEVAPQLQNRVELYTGTTPIFDVFNLEADIDKILNERVQLPNGAYLVIEETEALVTIDVNGGAGMLGKNMKSAAILEANLAAARQIAAELRLRDIGGIIVIDFIDMDEEEHESLVYEEMRRAILSDRSIIFLSEISELGLMELTRRRVRPSVSFMISDPCSCCHGTGRVEALDTTFSKIERAVLRLVANDAENIHFEGRTWKKVLLRVDPVMFEFLTRKQRTAQLSSSLKVQIILKVGREMARGSFELSELKLENEKQLSRTAQQQRTLRKGAHLGASGKKGVTTRT